MKTDVAIYSHIGHEERVVYNNDDVCEFHWVFVCFIRFSIFYIDLQNVSQEFLLTLSNKLQKSCTVCFSHSQSHISLSTGHHVKTT